MERFVILVFVLLLHMAVLGGLWAMPPSASPQPLLYVDLVGVKPPLPPPPAAPVPPAAPRTTDAPRPASRESKASHAVVPLVVDSVAPTAEPSAAALAIPEATLPPPPAPQAVETFTAAAPPSAPPAPVTLSAELAISCPERPPPGYPLLSRRLGEEGAVLLRVELDDRGTVSRAAIAASSGFVRLDEAALAAVRSWRCLPVWQEGRPVPAIALQPFQFVLRGS